MLTDNIIRRVCVCVRRVKYDYIPARVARGEFFLWDDRKLKCLEVNKGEFMIGARFRNLGNDMEWGFGGIHGPEPLSHSPSQKLDEFLVSTSWEELTPNVI
ncbi:hypothetical protein HAX54_046895 [Datura stramonium]|uniref:Uncharacterized protein n=1 Tax=Datura stramonium TaxID=4076 RepID=A0ABS8WLG9_DATST|nr:hypothetical protein [Datura stramonium]